MSNLSEEEVQRRCEDGLKKLQASGPECHSLVKKCLTQADIDLLKSRRSALGATFWDVIASGVACLDANIGVYAPDAESYKLFAPFMDKIILAYHGFGPDQTHPPSNFGKDEDIAKLAPLDPDGKYIQSTRIRCGRSLAGLPFNPCLTEEQYRLIEKTVSEALAKIPHDDLKGTYHPLVGMDKAFQKQLIADHYLFKEGDPHKMAANGLRFWPVGRGIFFTPAKNFLVWLCEGDHIRIICMQPGGDVGCVLARWKRAVTYLQDTLKLSRDDHLGWLTCCPTNLGCSVRASVHIRLPKLVASGDFKKTCESLGLQTRGIHGEHSDPAECVYDVSNLARLGLTEYDAVMKMYNGVKRLIEIEQSL